MARAKPKWRKVLNARFLRWWALGRVVRLFPAFGRKLAFFPDHIDMIEGADDVLSNEASQTPPSVFEPHMEFLSKCTAHDSKAPGIELPNGVVTGRRTALYRKAWIDTATSSVLLPEKARTVLVRGAYANWNATSARLGRQRVTVEGRAFCPLNTKNYFHVILENMIRLLDLLDSGVITDAPLTIVTQPGLTRVEDAFYNGLCKVYPWVTVQSVPTDALVEPGEAVLHFPPNNYWEWPPLSPSTKARMDLVFDNAYGHVAKAAGPGNLYLSRTGAKLRDPTNAAALVEALSQKGFAEFIASDQNHADQIAHFRAANRVVAVHGAGLTNLIFCSPGTKVIEVFPENFIKSPYWWLAQQLDLDYRPVIGGPGDYDQRFEVDIGAVLTALEDG